MAFLRIEKKKSGSYLRIVETFRESGAIKHKTLYSLGKIEDYSADQLKRIAEKLLEATGEKIEDIVKGDFEEIVRINYGYSLIINNLWNRLNLSNWAKRVSVKSRVRFEWATILKFMIAERLNEPCSKHASFGHQEEYIGFGDEPFDLHHFYRTLDLVSHHQDSLKETLFKEQRNLFSEALDVVFYDVTTLYFDSQIEEDNALRKKGYSKDGKAHKTQVVLGLLVDKMRNPITYHIYEGNTYEGNTMLDALGDLKQKFTVDQVVVVADSAMIDSENRSYIDQSENLTYILGDRIKNLPKNISEQLISKQNHKPLEGDNYLLTYYEIEYNDRRIICTYSEKRAKKDKYEREKLVEKAQKLLENTAQLKQSKKKGAGRFKKQENKETFLLDTEKIKADEKWDGFKALATTTNLNPKEVIAKYADLFEVEHAFRNLKSQLKVRPMFHWTNKRIEGHIAMCFIAYVILNNLRLASMLSDKEIVRTIDKMQLSQIKDKKTGGSFFIRSTISQSQKKLIETLKIVVPKDTSSQESVNQMFKQ
jgi:transposase